MCLVRLEISTTTQQSTQLLYAGSCLQLIIKVPFCINIIGVKYKTFRRTDLRSNCFSAEHTGVEPTPSRRTKYNNQFVLCTWTDFVFKSFLFTISSVAKWVNQRYFEVRTLFGRRLCEIFLLCWHFSHFHYQHTLFLSARQLRVFRVLLQKLVQAPISRT